MKLNKIRALCLSRRRFTLIHGPDADWLSDDVHMWLVPDVPITADVLPGLSWLSRKQANKCLIREQREPDPCYQCARDYDETQLERMGDVQIDDLRIVIFRTDLGAALYLDRAALDAADIPPDDDAEYALRQDPEGEPLIAAYVGMFCVALLRPARADVAELLRRSLASLAAIPVLGLEAEPGKEAMTTEIDD